MTNVKGYTDSQIIERVKSLADFKYIPDNYWLIGVRSNEDAFNISDDKFYLFKGEQFILTSPSTTNAGIDLLSPSNPRGEAVVEADHIFYDCWERKLHRQKVLAYCQRLPLPIHRDNNRNKKTEELGKAVWEICGINNHPMSYIFGSEAVREIIGKWSLGCQCWAIRKAFDRYMKLTEGQKYLTYALLNEW